MFNEFINAISRRLESTSRGESLITVKTPRRVEVIRSSELNEFLKYCRDTETVLNIDIRSLLSLTRDDMDYINIEFKKNDVSVDITWWKYMYFKRTQYNLQNSKNN